MHDWGTAGRSGLRNWIEKFEAHQYTVYFSSGFFDAELSVQFTSS
jgi:hypothetical protein